MVAGEVTPYFQKEKKSFDKADVEGLSSTNMTKRKLTIKIKLKPTAKTFSNGLEAIKRRRPLG